VPGNTALDHSPTEIVLGEPGCQESIQDHVCPELWLTGERGLTGCQCPPESVACRPEWGHLPVEGVVGVGACGSRVRAFSHGLPALCCLPVVYHHGNSATGGHYTTDVFQIGLNGWLRIDDQTVKVINQYQVVKPPADRTAYLLYYRRVDLL
jgi:hypothetical protein